MPPLASAVTLRKAKAAPKLASSARSAKLAGLPIRPDCATSDAGPEAEGGRREVEGQQQVATGGARLVSHGRYGQSGLEPATTFRRSAVASNQCWSGRSTIASDRTR